jgi:cytidylate kinase
MKRHPRSAHEMVDHEVRKWRLDRSRADREDEHEPVVTVSHCHGSLGAELARAVAERLDYTCWDRELLREMARQTEAPEELLAALDERKRNAVERLVAAFDQHAFVTPSDYLQALVRTVHTIAQQGSAVIVGRGAQYILEPHAALRIRVVRPLEKRIREVQEREATSAREASRQVSQVDTDRRLFIREHFVHDNREPADYDLVVNTGTMPLDCAVDSVVSAYRLRFPARSQQQASPRRSAPSAA